MRIPNCKVPSFVQPLQRVESCWSLIEDFADELKPGFEALDVRSTGCVPILVESRYVGAITFDDCVAPRRWSQAEIAMLTSAAHALAAALHRQRLEREHREEIVRYSGRVERQARVLAAIAQSAEELLGAPDPESCIDAVLARIGKETKADRACLAVIQWTDDDPLIHGWQEITHEWCRIAADTRFIRMKKSAPSKPLSNTIRIQIADDHPVVRDGLAAILNLQEDMEVVAESGDGLAAVEDYKTHRPDVLVLDLRMPELDGIEVLREVMVSDPSARILIVTTYQTDEDIYRCLKCGAKGYILKDSDRETIIEAVREVAVGNSFTPARITSKLIQRLGHSTLTPRELEVLKEVATGLANKEIAARIFVSEGTVKTHLKAILEKLGAQSRTEAVTNARNQGILRD